MTMSWRSWTRSDIEPPFEPIGTRDIISTPPEIDEVELARPDGRGGVEVRLHRGAALTVDRRAADRDGPARGQRDVAADVPGLLVDLRHAAPLHVLDLRRIDVVAGEQAVDDLRRELVAADVRERAVLLADRAADGVDDECVGFPGRHDRNSTGRGCATTAAREESGDAAQEREDRAAEAGAAVRALLAARARSGSPRWRTRSSCLPARNLTTEGERGREFVVLVEGMAEVAAQGTAGERARPRRLPRRDRARHRPPAHGDGDDDRGRRSSSSSRLATSAAAGRGAVDPGQGAGGRGRAAPRRRALISPLLPVLGHLRALGVREPRRARASSSTSRRPSVSPRPSSRKE